MWKWAQGAVASVTGAQEPEYGAEAFQSIDSRVAGLNPYGELQPEDYNWQQPAQSHVETQTFYFNSPEYFGFVQLIHSNPVNLAFTSQFTFMLRKVGDPDVKVWGSHRLSSAEVVGGRNFKAERFSIELINDYKTYHFSGFCTDDIQVDLYFDRVGSGFKIGEDGTSRYGTDPSNPWGTMRHVFWPRCSASGTIVVRSKNLLIDLPKGQSQGLVVGALQGMKPHHCAARWNFLNFQGPTLSVGLMEFTTPNSYGRQCSSVGGATYNGEILMTAVNCKTEHGATSADPNGDGTWPAPTEITFTLEGPRTDAGDLTKPVRIEISGKLTNCVDRVDVMSELPTFVKRVASGLSGASPIIYQYYNELTAKITMDGETFEEKGNAFSEATFIS